MLGSIRSIGFLLPAAAVIALSPSGDLHAQALINEILASTTGTDVEYIELFGAPGTSLAGLSLVVAEGENNANRGRYTFRHDFAAADRLGDNGFYLIGNARVAQTYGVSPNAIVGDNALQNGSETFALVETGSLTSSGVAGGELVLDAVALAGPASSLPDSIFYFEAPVVGPAARCSRPACAASPTEWIPTRRPTG